MSSTDAQCSNTNEVNLTSPSIEFKNHIKRFIDSLSIKQEVCGNYYYGCTLQGKQFALVLCRLIRVCKQFNVYLIHDFDNDLNQRPPEVCRKFDNEHEAVEYIKATRYNLEIKCKIDNDYLKAFHHFVTETLNAPGSEVYRLQDVDAEGSPFVIVLQKKDEYYETTLFKGTQSPYTLFTTDSRKHADKHTQKHRNKLKGDVPVESRKEGVEIINPIRTDASIKSQFTKQTLDQDSANILQEAPEFVAFVNESVLRAFRGQEVYRKYGETCAGQRFAFVVSKLDYYIVRIVLEPDPRWRTNAISAMIDLIEAYSQTFYLTDARNRLVIDSWVASTCTLLTDRNENILDGWTMGGFNVKVKAESQEKLMNILASLLTRGDHIRRNLKIGGRKVAYHDGIYLGDGKVAHYTTDNNARFTKFKDGSGAGIISLQEFLKDEKTAYLAIYQCPDRSGEEISALAEWLIQNKVWYKNYHLASKNCQLFVSLCTTRKYSRGFLQETKGGKKLMTAGFIFLNCYVPAYCLVTTISILLTTPTVTIPIAATVVPIAIIVGIVDHRKKSRKEALKIGETHVEITDEQAAVTSAVLPSSSEESMESSDTHNIDG